MKKNHYIHLILTGIMISLFLLPNAYTQTSKYGSKIVIKSVDKANRNWFTRDILIPQGSSGWKYTEAYPTSDPPIDTSSVASWYQMAFTDLSWKDGSTAFGFGYPTSFGTTLNDNGGSYFFRKTFDIPSPVVIQKITLKIASNNGAKVYLNGVIVDTDPAFGQEPGHAYEYWNRTINVPLSLVQVGRNVMAIQVYNADISTDAYLDLELSAEKTTNIGGIEATVCDFDTGAPLKARVILQASTGQYVDGAQKSQIYNDGRFYVDGNFSVDTLSGVNKFSVYHGFHYEPLIKVKINVALQKVTHLTIYLKKWADMRGKGWFCGEEATIQHDYCPQIPTDFPFCNLVGRAEGMDYLMEQGPFGGYNYATQQCALYSDSEMILGAFPELRYLYTGHANQMGTTSEVLEADYANTVLPLQAAKINAYSKNGLLTYTHPGYNQMLHWMTCVEIFNDAVMNSPADAIEMYNTDTCKNAWYSILNSGCRLNVITSTDNCLDRKNNTPPGYYRTYIYTGGDLSWPSLVNGVKQGKTMVTSGMIFPFLKIDGLTHGDTCPLDLQHSYQFQIEVYSYYISSIKLIRNGQVIKTFGSSGAVNPFQTSFSMQETEPAWYTLEVTDSQGKWAITNPVYIGQFTQRPFTYTLYGSIGNFGTSAQSDYFLHISASVSQDSIQKIQILKDDAVYYEFTPAAGNYLPNGLIPLSYQYSAYSTRWTWYPTTVNPVHFQADYPVTANGTYTVKMTTSTNKTYQFSAPIIYSYDSAINRQYSRLIFESANHNGIKLEGYSEDLPPNNWWYTRNPVYKFQRQIPTTNPLIKDLWASFSSTGVKYRNSWAGDWTTMTPTFADQIAAGDFDGDGKDDLLGIWKAASGIWIRYATGTWSSKIINADNFFALTAADMNQDGKDDLVGSWAAGMYWRDSATGTWTRFNTTPCDWLSAGDMNGDGKDDLLLGYKTNANGVWIRYYDGTWSSKLVASDQLKSLAVGDINGDKKADFISSWDVGVFWRDSASSKWTLLNSTPADLVAAGDLDDDGKDDVLCAWNTTSLKGIYVKYNTSASWENLTISIPVSMVTGNMRE